MRTESRRSLLAKVHIAAKDLGLQEDAYRDMLEGLTGQRSAAKLTDKQLAFVVGSLQRKGGWGAAPVEHAAKRHGAKPKPRASSSCDAMLKKIEALLADAGRPWAYAESMARRMYQVERLEWATAEHLRGIIAALVKDAGRQARKMREASAHM
ncbi:Mu-like prophage protein gp16 [Humidesulfovibrio mexicanus]|uniref:Mu-like prophage protein gp16 n=1 Tax=Humidesulfovibrio mexicanus TaxID=147047 RepID=A0A238XNA3_9BACT|nr:regulatory protein GemA [Humidesulfovibrio mexicanus]SNR59469.1 Mu-like prophage protein gp16 [Humidesulfovibrio mexicanus]